MCGHLGGIRSKLYNERSTKFYTKVQRSASGNIWNPTGCPKNVFDPSHNGDCGADSVNRFFQIQFNQPIAISAYIVRNKWNALQCPHSWTFSYGNATNQLTILHTQGSTCPFLMTVQASPPGAYTIYRWTCTVMGTYAFSLADMDFLEALPEPTPRPMECPKVNPRTIAMRIKTQMLTLEFTIFNLIE
jgi:hypothetical protein